MAKAKKKLVVVESPSKIKKISKFLGPDYIVKASMGHVMDLPPKGLGVDIKNDFEPSYAVISKKKQAVADLKKVAQNVDEVYLATDPDREGEAIAWSVQTLLSGKRKSFTFYRVTFHEITKKAVLKAFQVVQQIDDDKVEAQKARRIVDRLTGFKISPLLWRRSKAKKEGPSRSAGRVQSVGLQMIVDRQREIDSFVPVKYWTVEALVTDGTTEFTLELVQKHKLSIDSQEKADKCVAYLEAHDFVVEQVDKKQEQKQPYAPFTTSTLQQACSSIFNWTPKKTMAVAQQLYEGGHITYMRTDSAALSDDAIKSLQTLIPAITTKQYLPATPNTFKSKAKNTQEAHEAIRPTNLDDDLPQVLKGASVTGNEAKLLELIWRRTVACQMAPALFDKTEILVKAGKQMKLKATGQVQTFDGFLRIWTHTNTKENVVPEVKVGQKLDKIEIKAIEHETKPPSRYNGASLVKELEANGVGRPSTYAAIIDTLISREYVKMDKKAFVPTEKGMEVSDFLKEHFDNIINVNFTSQMEEDLDKICTGDKTRLELLRTFWEELSSTIDKAKAKLHTNEVSEEVCPACESALFIKLNRKTQERFLACSNKDCKKTFDMDKDGKPLEKKIEKLGKPCPECGGDLIKKAGKYGVFYGCSGYKNGCGVTASEDGEIRIPPKDTGKKCKKCKKGTMVERTNKSTGEKFLGCSSYPKCKNVESVT